MNWDIQHYSLIVIYVLMIIFSILNHNYLVKLLRMKNKCEFKLITDDIHDNTIKSDDPTQKLIDNTSINNNNSSIFNPNPNHNNPLLNNRLEKDIHHDNTLVS